MTIRPQLASSPATAVLTNGELAMARPMTLAARALAAPLTVILTNLLAPSPSLTTCSARSSSKSSSFLRKSRSSGSLAVSILACDALPVANAKRVSLVDVSESTVDAIEGLGRPFGQQLLQHGGRQGGVGEDEGQHGGHIGGDHPGALAKAVDAHLFVADFGGSGGHLGIGVGGQNGMGGVAPAVGRQFSQGVAQGLGDFRILERNPDGPGRGDKHLAGLAAALFRRRLGGTPHRSDAGPTGEGIGVPRIDHDQPRGAAFQGLTAPQHRRRGRQRLGENRRRRWFREPARRPSDRSGPGSAARKHGRPDGRRRAATARQWPWGASGEMVAMVKGPFCPRVVEPPVPRPFRKGAGRRGTSFGRCAGLINPPVRRRSGSGPAGVVLTASAFRRKPNRRWRTS